MVNNPCFVQAGIPRGRDIAKTVFRLVAAGRYALLNQLNSQGSHRKITNENYKRKIFINRDISKKHNSRA